MRPLSESFFFQCTNNATCISIEDMPFVNPCVKLPCILCYYLTESTLYPDVYKGVDVFLIWHEDHKRPGCLLDLVI